jgi:hypothetical protein
MFPITAALINLINDASDGAPTNFAIHAMIVCSLLSFFLLLFFKNDYSYALIVSDKKVRIDNGKAHAYWKWKDVSRIQLEDPLLVFYFIDRQILYDYDEGELRVEDDSEWMAFKLSTLSEDTQSNLLEHIKKLADKKEVEVDYDEESEEDSS